MIETWPLTPKVWDDVVAVFGGGAGRGDCGRCWCQWWRLPRSGLGMDADRESLKARFRAEVEAGVPGLLAYRESVPAGFVRVGPRSQVPQWNGAGRLTAPLDQREAEDLRVWGISCFVVRVGHRGKGVMNALLDAAIAHARSSDARLLDACPVETNGKRPANSLYHGTASAFAERGFTEVARRKADRPLMRLTL